MLLLPGMIDLHAHLPQIPNAGIGAGLDLLTWLERDIFPLERAFDAEAAARVAPQAYRAFAAAGTTTVVLYGAVFEASVDVAFATAEQHGIRAVIGKVMMDRLRYDARLADAGILERSLRETADLIERWHCRDDGRLRYAVTPRFAVSCSPEMLRESAALARDKGTYWQTHLAEDRRELDEVHRLHPAAVDYTDVYDRATGLGPHALLAHAIHLSDREVVRLAETDSKIAHCPASNLFLASGAMPLSRYLDAGLSVGLGSDVAAGPDLSIFGAMRAGAYTQNGRRSMLGDQQRPLEPLDWLRLATLGGATALGQQDAIGSLEPGKEADFILVDPELTEPLPGAAADEAQDLMSRLIFRAHPEMVRGAWVRGRRLAAA
jgi:guanine deaminase